MVYRILVPVEGVPSDLEAVASSEVIAGHDGEVDLLRLCGASDSLDLLRPSGLAGCNLLRAGDAVTEITRCAEERASDLVVHPEPSLAAAILRNTSKPVLMPRGFTRAAIRRILVPVDRSGRAACVLESVRALAERTGAEIVLLYVAPADPDPMPHLRAGEPTLVTHDPAWRLQELADLIERDGFYAWPIIDRGDAVERILHQAEDVDADVIAMGTHGLPNAFARSVTQGVLHGTRRALLVRRAGYAPERRDLPWALRCWTSRKTPHSV